jgi:hypothetical protein
MTEAVKCLPCPFCGCAEVDPEGTACEVNGSDGFQATCDDCRATGPEAPDAWMAAYRWNSRCAVHEQYTSEK